MDENPNSAAIDTEASHFLSRHPPQYLSAPRFIALLRRWVNEANEGKPGFIESLRRSSLVSLNCFDSKRLRQALQCLAITGTADDLDTIRHLAEHPDADVARDAQTCAFEIAHHGRF